MVNPKIPENTRHTRKYPIVNLTLLPDPNPTCYPVFCPVPDPVRLDIEKPYPLATGLDPHCWMVKDFSNPWKLRYPGMTSSMWCDWVQLQHRCSIIDLKTPLESRALTRKQCRLEQSNTIGLNWITIPTEKDSLLLRAALSQVQVHVLENCLVWIAS